MNDARRWALGMAGLLTQVNGEDHAVLGGGLATPDEIESRLATLRRDWDSGTRDELLKTLQWLASEGHRKEYNEASRLDLELSAKVGVGQPIRTNIDAEMAGHMNFARRHRARIGHRSLLAWDAARLVTVAGWGALARLVSEDEAWSYILPMAQAVQRTYASWEEFGKHHLLGREFWSGEWDGRFARCFLDMFASPASPWRTLPWTLDLSQHGLTAPLQTIVVEAPAAPAPPAPPQAAKSNTGLIVGLGIAGLVVLVGGGLGIAYAMGAFGHEAPPAPAASAPPAAPSSPVPPAATSTAAASPTHPPPLPPHPAPKKPH
jgi:hypothetical protein